MHSRQSESWNSGEEEEREHRKVWLPWRMYPRLPQPRCWDLKTRKVVTCKMEDARRKEELSVRSCWVACPPSALFLLGRERESQKYGFCYQQLCCKAVVSSGLVFKWVITISSGRSERKLLGDRGRNRAAIAVTTSQSRSPQSAWSRNFGVHFFGGANWIIKHHWLPVTDRVTLNWKGSSVVSPIVQKSKVSWLRSKQFRGRCTCSTYVSCTIS